MLETQTLLIADSSEEFRTTLAQALQGNYRVLCCRTGMEALDILRRETPDLFIMDLMLPEVDGLTLLQRLHELGIHPTILATTRLVNDYVISATTKLGVEYLMIKPCDIRAIVRRVRDLSSRKSRAAAGSPDRRTYVSNLLTALGISSKLRGYNYLRAAILAMLENPMQSITKELYPAVARELRCTPSQVERSIRNAIQQAWEKRSDETWLRYFPGNEDGSVPRPSNATFICRLADRIQLDQMQMEAAK